ncbi:peroxidase family protein [Arthrobacter sp. CAN_C5]|uniref:peroxidase family protein n=1 Tax=Arthrobacter sp. CAN_C5 TaxID=2760706 RepID=UPI001AE9D416|nr:peroxidase family protein [Arthrobacter sp. CAN_C5]MBP2216350.1 Ca2+-binding RTX toxin-like protein [Arthrobacter sp. CAN_C5]
MNIFGRKSAPEKREASQGSRAAVHRALHSAQSPNRGQRLPVRLAAIATALLFPLGMLLPVTGANAVVAPTGQGFTVTPSDLAFILKQIKIAEAHVANTTSATGPCGALVGTGPNQIATPLISHGLRTVDGSCNNLQAGQETFGAADQPFPRLAPATFSGAESGSLGGPPSPTSYNQTAGNVFDSQPRTISNLIVDQTSTNPAAVAAAGLPIRSQNNTGVTPCTTDPDPLAVPAVDGVPLGCTPSFQTLFIPNVTTDVGLSPPYNSLFTLFGQFFDHGIDQTVKGGGTVFVPLKGDDPLIAGPDHKVGTADDLNPNLRFMVLTRGKNQPGPDGQLGTADDVRDALNTDTPWVDQSQTYTSHASHQVFLREYVNNSNGRPVSTGKLLGGPAGPTEGGMATWAGVKNQAASLLGLKLEDADALDVPMIAADAYGKFIPGPARGLPQYVTLTGLVEGDTASPVPVPNNVRHFETPFLTDIANNAVPKPGFTPDPDNVVTPSLTPCAQPGFPAGCVNQYDDEILDLHFAAGDGRVNENIGLTAIHQVFHSEHDRMVGDIKNTLASDTSAAGIRALAEWKSALGAEGWNGERLFQAARFVTEMEYQHLVFEEFARKVQPAINPFEPFAFVQTDVDPAVTAEFAHAVYRFGHSMLTETISRRNEDRPGNDNEFGTSDDVAGTQNDISLLEGFLNPPAYTDGGPAGDLTSEEAAGSVFMGMSDQVGNELDEFVTDTLRNNLLGLPLDLAAINIARARSEGIPRLNVLRRSLHAATNDGQLRPYVNWIDFGESIKHPESLVNFVAAYGLHPTVTGATTLKGKREAARAIVNPNVAAGDVAPDDAADFMNSTGAWANNGTSSITGLDDVDLWVGGLAEQTNVFGGLLGSTFNYVFESQMTDLQNGDRLYYLARTPGMNLRTQLEGNSFSELIMRNTNAKSLKADPFATSDCKFELKNLAGTPGGFTSFGNTIADDQASECNETALLIRMPDGTIKYRSRNTVDPAGINGQSVYNGTSGTDRVFGGNDSDTFWGNLGNDVIEGGDGADVALGGEGNDILTDLAGDDVLKGGPGNDAINAGPGLDLIMGGDGKDFMNGGGNANTTFAGEGDDFLILGEGIDQGIGDGGDDWIEGGDQPDGLIGDSSNLFFTDDNKPGHDIAIGQGGDDDYDLEGGDDIGVAGPGIEKNVGAAGYDWSISQGDPQPMDSDLSLPLPPLNVLTVGVRDKFNENEALSGWKFNDKIRGDDVVPSEVGGGGFIGCDVLDQAGVDRIDGLDALLPASALTTPLADVAANSVIGPGECPGLAGPVWGDGNILLGGAGSDLLEGRGADDLIDGDAYLSVRLSVRNAAGEEIGSAGVEGPGQSAMASQYLSDVNGNLTGPTLQQDVFAGKVNPGNIVVIREVLSPANGTSVDIAQFSDLEANYDVTTIPTGAALGSPGSVTTVVHARGTQADGTDTVRNVEELRFSDFGTPAAPVIGTATAANASATVSWTSPAGLVTGYNVRVVDAAGIQVGALRPAANTATSLVVTGLVNGQAYRFQVEAINAVGTGPLSALSTAVTPNVVPGTPTNVVGVRGNTSATLSWTAPPANGGTAITEYRVQVLTGTTVVRTVTFAGAATTGRAVTGLTNGTAYTFRVQAVNALGAGALSAASATVVPGAALPAAPVIGTATAGNTSATVRWTAAAGATSYNVRVVNAAGTQVGALRPAAGTATSVVVTGLANGQAYRFQVQALNASGASAFSALSAAVTPNVVPGVPTNVVGVRGNTSVTLSWTAPPANGGTAITEYRVQVLTGTTLVRTVTFTGTATTGRTVTGLLNGVSYTFRVQAVNALGAGALSTASAAVSPAGPPGVPVILAPTQGAVGGTLTANANWNAPASTGGSPITGYRVRALRMAADGVTISGTPVTVTAGATLRTLSFTLPAGNYRFDVVAVNAIGSSLASARSAIVQPR